MRSPSFALALWLGVTACQLVEVVVAPGQRTLVVQAVIDRSQTTQRVVLEYSTIGDTTIQGGGNTVPPGRPRFAVGGAVVTVEHLAGGACPGLVEGMPEIFPSGAGALPSGRYEANLTCLGSGEPLALWVVTPAGEVVTGETVIPFADTRSVRAGASFARFVMDTVRFDRDHDTLRVTMETRQGRGMQIEIRRLENHDQISVIFINDSLGVAFPGNLVNPFEGDSGETTFRAGAYYLMTVALADSNYFDFARTFSDPITGRGFLNHLKGGLGVFGSIETTAYVLRTVGTVNDPREGTYRFTGPNLDGTVEWYIDDLHDEEFSGFTDGTWPTPNSNPPSRVINVSGDGRLGFFPGLTATNPNAFQFTFVRPATQGLGLRRYMLRGVRSDDGNPFSVNLIVSSNNGTLLNTTVTGVQVAGRGS